MKQLLKLSFLMLALLLPATAMTQELEVEINGINYFISGNEAEVYYNGGNYSGNVIIPSTVTYDGTTYTVTRIGYAAFANCTGLTSVTIPNSVIAIEAETFSCCTNLLNVTIGNSVKTIDSSAFEGCPGLTNITIPNSVTYIGINVLRNCTGLTSITVSSGNPKYDSRENCNAIIETASNTLIQGCQSTTIPNSVTSIGAYSFASCTGLTSITIPNSVTFIGNDAFRGCRRLNKVYCKILNPSALSMGSDVFYLESNDYGNRCLYVPRSKLADYQNDTKWSQYFRYINGTYDFEVDGIYYNIINGNEAEVTQGYNYNDLPSHLTIPTTVTYDGTTYSVTAIGEEAFETCDKLTSISIPSSIISIGDFALSGTGLTSIDIPNSVTSIGNGAFSQCKGLTSLSIPNSVTAIGLYAFGSCDKLTRITVSSSNPKYDSRENCNAIIETASNTLITGCKNSIIHNSVTSIGEGAFDGCSGLTSVNIPNSVTTIGGGAFYECFGLTYIDIPNSVTTIGAEAFIYCNGLTSITIPNSVTLIGRGAFEGCSRLTSVNITDLAAWCNIQFVDGFSNPCSLAHHLFLNGLEIKDLVIPDSVTSIKQYAFTGCTELTSVTIPNSVSSIYNYAFSGCNGLTSFNIPLTIKSIGNFAFYNCFGLNDVYSYYIDPSEITMGNYVFSRNPNNYEVRTLYVPYGTSAAYQSDTRWSQYFGSIVEMDPIPVESIELDRSAAVLVEGETLQLTATVLPEDATYKMVNWATSNPEVATVDDDGLVTALSVGTATITAMTADGSNLSASCAVTVRSLSASECISIDGLTAFHGDTIVIPVKMVNEASIISFQTDIYMPDGLELLLEDGEYMIDPSERMTRTHSIMSNAVSNGAIRVVCYSSNYKPFTGESGDDLFYLTVKVDDDAEGDYIIRLKNTLFTNSDFDEIAAPDAAGIINVKAYILGDANNSGTVTVTDVVVTSQYILELNPEPFNFTAADVNTDGSITVTDVSRIAWMVLNPTLNAPLRAPALWNNGDRLSGNDITLTAGETRTVSIALDNAMDYSAFQLDLRLPEGLTASNFAVTDRAGSHTFDVSTLGSGDIRALCYSPALTAINGHEGALLTFDVTAIGAVNGNITIDGIELVTTGCQTVRLDAFAIGVNTATSVNEVASDKTIASVDYFNLAGQQITEPSTGVTLIVTTYSDGTRTTTKIIK